MSVAYTGMTGQTMIGGMVINYLLYLFLCTGETAVYETVMFFKEWTLCIMCIIIIPFGVWGWEELHGGLIPSDNHGVACTILYPLTSGKPF